MFQSHTFNPCFLFYFIISFIFIYQPKPMIIVKLLPAIIKPMDHHLHHNEVSEMLYL